MQIGTGRRHEIMVMMGETAVKEWPCDKGRRKSKERYGKRRVRKDRQGRNTGWKR